MTDRKQISMVLPESLISAIKERAALRGQTITAYITRLVEHDLASGAEEQADVPAGPLSDRIDALEHRIGRLERQEL